MQPEQPPAVPPDQWYPPAQPPPRARIGLSSNAVVSLVGLVLGILIFTGLVSLHAAFLLPPPSAFPPSTDPRVIAYLDTIRALGWVSIVAMDLAVSLSVMIAWVVGSLKGEQSEATRRGLFVFSSVFLSIWLVFSFFEYSLFRGIAPFR